jgi:hypothetical protein
MTRGEFLGGCLVALLITCSPGLAGVAVTALTGPDRLDAPAPARVGEAAQEREATPWVPQRPRPQVASRSRAVVRHSAAGVGTLNWHALAMCESTDNPHAVSASGKYRGLYQFDLRTWRSVGGSGDPAQASRAEQTYRAQLLFADRGPAPWPVCGRRL